MPRLIWIIILLWIFALALGCDVIYGLIHSDAMTGIKLDPELDRDALHDNDQGLAPKSPLTGRRSSCRESSHQTRHGIFLTVRAPMA
jgi:hypothetical protein